MSRALKSILAGLTVLTMAVLLAPPTSARAVWSTVPVHVDLSGKLPSYHVDPTPRLVGDPSGRGIPLPGKTYLAINLNPAIAHNDGGQSTLAGPRRQVCDMPTLRGYVVTGDYEGVMSVGLGLSHVTSFRVLALSSPTRLVIDVHH